MFSIEIVTRTKTTMSRTVIANMSDMHDLLLNVHERITASSGSRCAVYCSFTVHSVYKDTHKVNDRYRISFTHFQVLCHSLCVETGRWNR